MRKTTSQTYARALFELDSSKDFASQLKNFSDIFRDPKTFQFFLSVSVPLTAKRKVLTESLKTAPAFLRNFFYILLENKKFSCLPEIVENYQKLLDEKNKICRGLIFSSKKPAGEEKKKVEKVLSQFFNKTVALEPKEDKKLIAGFLVNVEGYIFKGTSRQYLKNFEKLGGL